MGCGTLVLKMPNMLPLFAPPCKVALQWQLDVSCVTAKCKMRLKWKLVMRWSKGLQMREDICMTEQSMALQGSSVVLWVLYIDQLNPYN